MNVKTHSHLVIIAGPRCAGKSKVINDIEAGSSMLTNWLNIKTLDYKSFSLNHLDKNPGKNTGKLIVHYDFFRPLMRKLNSYTSDSIWPLSQKFHKVTVFTLISPSHELQKRMAQRVASIEVTKDLQDKRIMIKMKKLRYLQQVYADPKSIAEYYFKWLDFCFSNYCEIYCYINSERHENIIKIENWSEFENILKKSDRELFR